MPDKRVEELMEYMARSLQNTVRMESRCIHESPLSVFRDRAKQILSYPNLALIDRERKLPELTLSPDALDAIEKVKGVLPNVAIAIRKALSLQSKHIQRGYNGYLPIIPLAEEVKE